jgi:hypothetical protein
MLRGSGLRGNVLAAGAAALTALGVGACATLESLRALPRLDFFVDHVEDASLAGIDLGRIREPRELGAGDMLRVANAVRRRSVPLRFTLHLGAENPSATAVDVRLERLEWTLLLRDRDTVSGEISRGIAVPPAGSTVVPIPMEVDLVRFFDESAEDLVDLALRAVGVGDERVALELRAIPTVRTPLGLFRFPSPITIASREL